MTNVMHLNKIIGNKKKSKPQSDMDLQNSQK